MFIAGGAALARPEEASKTQKRWCYLDTNQTAIRKCSTNTVMSQPKRNHGTVFASEAVVAQAQHGRVREDDGPICSD